MTEIAEQAPGECGVMGFAAVSQRALAFRRGVSADPGCGRDGGGDGDIASPRERVKMMFTTSITLPVSLILVPVL